MMKKDNSVALEIGGTVIGLHSRGGYLPPVFPNAGQESFYGKFIYRGRKRPDIDVAIRISGELPRKRGARVVFSSRHYLEDAQDWRLYRAPGGYWYEFLLSGERKLMYIDPGFTRVRAYLLAQPRRGNTWHWGDLVFNFLQVLLNLYWARTGQALIMHGCGIKEKGRGMVFAGESGSGKSTLARIWHEHSMAEVLNDDRVIVRRAGRGFLVCGSPWNGDFAEYGDLRPAAVKLKRIFFLSRLRRNESRGLSGPEILKALYPAIFPVFWDKRLLTRQLELCSLIARKVPVSSLGFRKDKSAVGFIRKSL